ncbi:MAG TPA: hypothetical protein EYQ61_08915 [Dehalococcoidia bacterium]|jgi:DNA-binding NtrC family response regulator|nr:hypothetical protein [Dehalococcoidia bacterium]HIK90045.1 hypothetical protein [Dehalococcoidia bacterium]
MLSFELSERVKIARLLTDAGFSIRNESAANIERFEQRVSDDKWDLIFLDARSSLASVAQAVELARVHAADTPIFSMIESDQENQAQLLDLGIVDLFTPDGMPRIAGSITRTLSADED